MSRRSSRQEHRAYEFVARPRKTRTTHGMEESYWTVRCRRKGEMGEWSLGWQPSSRAAEQAFFAWVEQHRTSPAPTDGTVKLVEVIDDYIKMVPTMAKRPMTKQNRVFRAKTLLAFVEVTNAAMSIADFNALHANALKARKYKRCTPLQEAMLTYTADLKDWLRAGEDAESMVFKTTVPGPHFLHDFKRDVVLQLEGVHFERDGRIHTTTLKDVINTQQSASKPPLYMTKTLIFVGLLHHAARTNNSLNPRTAALG